jgi:hypothetical protein
VAFEKLAGKENISIILNCWRLLHILEHKAHHNSKQHLFTAPRTYVSFDVFMLQVHVLKRDYRVDVGILP